jgi:hypothetical protein
MSGQIEEIKEWIEKADHETRLNLQFNFQKGSESFQ